MSIIKNIFLRPDFQETETHVWANIHYLQGYTSRSITSYQEMAEQMRKCLPGMELTNEELICGAVVKSTYCDKFSILSWNGLIPKENNFAKLGWDFKSKPPDYYTN